MTDRELELELAERETRGGDESSLHSASSKGVTIGSEVELELLLLELELAERETRGGVDEVGIICGEASLLNCWSKGCLLLSDLNSCTLPTLFLGTGPVCQSLTGV